MLRTFPRLLLRDTLRRVNHTSGCCSRSSRIVREVELLPGPVDHMTVPATDQTSPLLTVVSRPVKMVETDHIFRVNTNLKTKTIPRSCESTNNFRVNLDGAVKRSVNTI
jgi:hypothetical protein